MTERKYPPCEWCGDEAIAGEFYKIIDSTMPASEAVNLCEDCGDFAVEDHEYTQDAVFLDDDVDLGDI